MDVRRTLRKMRRLALAFHGSELRLLDRTERRAKVVHVAPTSRPEAKVGAQA
jgi:hypothetical protein